MSLLYDLEFNFIPQCFNSFGGENLIELLKDKEQRMVNVFNSYYRRNGEKPIFKKEDFCFLDISFGIGGPHIVYVKLPIPETQNIPQVFCYGYCFAFVSNKNNIEFRGLYTIEGSAWGTTCIGSIDANGTHTNYGPAGNNPNESINKVKQIVFGD